MPALRVLSVAYRLAPIQPDSIGGAEQVLAAIDRALVAAGHASTVLACEGSCVAGSLCPVAIESGSITAAGRERATQLFNQRLARLLDEQPFDVVHFHGIDVSSYRLDRGRLRDIPKLVTLHLPVDWYAPELFRTEGNLAFNTVSDWQRQRLPPGVAVRASIPNGVDLSLYRPAAHADADYFLCLGRICPEKGFDRALRSAHAAGVRLLIAGRAFDYPEHREHFERDIAPLLDAERRFVGAVVGADKRRLLAHARALLVPSRVAETCSLVTLEALACGTPVITSSTGAPAGWIEPGVTGWVADDDAAIAAALLRSGELSRVACRERAQRFDLRHTTERYLELYAELARLPAPRRSTPLPAQRRTPSDRVELVTSLTALRAIEPELLDLYQRDPVATPFQSPDWLVPWVEHLGPPGALRWIVVYRRGRAVASLPLMRSDAAGTSTLCWVGRGCSDRQDLLLDPSERAFALERAWAVLGELRYEVEQLELDELPEHSPSQQLLARCEGASVEAGSVCPVLELGRPLGELEAALPRWLRRNLRQTGRRLARLGRVEWQPATPSDAAERIEEFSGLHAARWQARGQPGVLADRAVLAFHRAAAPRLVAHGALELELGLLDGRPIVATYVLRRTHAHLYLFGFDPGWPTLSLGSLAIWRSIESAARAGLARYDFLRGCEPYKYAFGARNQQSFRCLAPGRAAQPRA